jgi:hypothetical protein
VIVLYPLVLIGAAVLIAKSRQRGLGARGRVWFGAWVLAGVLFTFSLLTGLSIGLLLFPAAAFVILWLSVNAPYWREVAGFAVGVVAVLLALLVTLV